MKKSRYTPEQIVYALKHAESGAETVCRKMGVSEATFYNWKKKHVGIGITEVRELRQFREESARRKRLVVSLRLGGISCGR